MKNSVLDTSYKLMSENTGIEYEKIKFNRLTEKEIILLANCSVIVAGSNIGILPYDQVNIGDKILNIVERSGANVVIIDDLNGVEFIDDKEIEKFFYKFKNVASMNMVNVFIIYNLQLPNNRYDKRPTLDDFPNESYYRVVDIIHFVFVPFIYHRNYIEEKILEVYIARGFKRVNKSIRMGISYNDTHLASFEE